LAKIKLFIKIALSLGLIYFVFSKIDIKELSSYLKEANFWYLLIAFLLYNLSKIISSFRLNYYFKEIGIELKESLNLKLYYLGMFYNLFLPGGIGGDGYKGWLLYKHFKIPLKSIAKALLFDRVSGLIALLFLLLLILPFSSLAKLWWFISIIAAGVLYYLYFYFSKRYKIFIEYFKHTASLGLLVQIIQIFSALAIIYALGSNIHIIDFIAVFLLSSIAGALPLTFGGIGAREATFFYAFSYLGYDVTVGIAFSVLFFIITALSSLIGIVFLEVAKEFTKN